MKTKKLFLPAILLACLFVAYLLLSAFVGYETKPAVSEGEFPFSITYEYQGETKTISGVFVCKFHGSQTIHRIHERFWDEEVIYNEGDYIVCQEELKKTVAVQPNMSAGYFMGDPLYRDYYQIYDVDEPTPYAEYYDYENDISFSDYHMDEELAEVGFKFIDISYPEPIENSFSFSGFHYEADNIIWFVALLLIFLLVCIIFVRKDKEYQYSYLDKSGIVVNFLVGLIAFPFIFIICSLFGLVGSGYSWYDQMIFNIPPMTLLFLSLSIMLRRKGYRKTGFFIQFGGVVMFVLVLLIEQISLWLF